MITVFNLPLTCCVLSCRVTDDTLYTGSCSDTSAVAGDELTYCLCHSSGRDECKEGRHLSMCDIDTIGEAKSITKLMSYCYFFIIIVVIIIIIIIIVIINTTIVVITISIIIVII